MLPVPEGKAILLGELTARVEAGVAPGDKCVVAGWPLQIDGRKRRAGAAVFAESGQCVAIGRATWIEVDANAFS